VAFAVEHHANMLPWRRHGVTYLPIPAEPGDIVTQLDAALAAIDGPVLVAMTGASNVTGERWPVAEAAEVAHRHGSRLFVDAAQLAPHVPIDMASWDVDYLALSGHKLYAPYGAGVLVGRADWLSQSDPFLRGGGAVDFVTLDKVAWTELPDRQEAGTPNTIGAVALGVACEVLDGVGMGELERDEQELYAYARRRLTAIDGLTAYSLWGPGHPRLGILTFNLAGMHHSLLASALSAEYGIAVRHGCFCAHPLVMKLLRADEEAIWEKVAGHDKSEVPGAVRISLGIGATEMDIDVVADAIAAIAADGPRWTYRQSRRSGEYEPYPDPRPLPELPFRLADTAIHHFGESS
jgi:selenocysteine lyase/cysteine desulfurase